MTTLSKEGHVGMIEFEQQMHLVTANDFLL